MKKMILLLVLISFYSSSSFSNYLNFKSTSVKEVASSISVITNKNIVIPSDVSADIDLIVPVKVSNRELLNLFYSAVLSSGLNFELDKNSIYIIRELRLSDNVSFFRSKVFNIYLDDDFLSRLPNGSFVSKVDNGYLVYTSPKFLSFLSKVEKEQVKKDTSIITRVYSLTTVKPSSLATFIPADLKYVAYDSINKLVVSGYAYEVFELAKKIEMIDGSLSVYQVDLIITAVNKTYSEIYNLDFEIANSLGGAVVGGGMVFGSSLNSSSLLLNWINSNSEFSLKSKPYMQLLDGHSSSLVVGQEVPFRSSVLDPDSLTRKITTIERQNVGLLFDVSVSSLSSDKVRLSVYQEFSSISNAQLLDATDVITDKQSLKTTLDLFLDRFYVVGGLSFKSKSNLKVSSPFFEEDSILDDVFSDTDSQSVERDLVIFIKVSKVSPSAPVGSLKDGGRR